MLSYSNLLKLIKEIQNSFTDIRFDDIQVIPDIITNEISLKPFETGDKVVISKMGGSDKYYHLNDFVKHKRNVVQKYSSQISKCYE